MPLYYQEALYIVIVCRDNDICVTDIHSSFEDDNNVQIIVFVCYLAITFV